tara:strand:+ start:1955 stop:3625 length:1671 start_codon:yes stop_codon:yes gene_type:complete
LIFAFLPEGKDTIPEVVEIGHWTSILPPFLAILIAVHFRSLVAALSSAFLLGSFLSFWPNYTTALSLGLKTFIWPNFTEQFSLYIFAFLFSLVGMIHLVYKGGGIHGMIHFINRVVKGPRTAKAGISLAGVAVFFDDYSNTIVVGSTMRELSDQWKISREKLAYLIDSTTAPIAGLALLSTWIAFEVFLFDKVSLELGLGLSGYGMFVEILPSRFYCWGTLAFVFLTSVLDRDFGPMYRAEVRAVQEGKVASENAVFLVSEDRKNLDPNPNQPQRWYNAVVPLACVIFGTVSGILVLGRSKIVGSGASFSFLQPEDWRNAFAMVTNPSVTPGGAMMVLFFASLVGGAVAILMLVAQRILSFSASIKAYFRALSTLWMALFILVMAWGMSKICTEGVHTDTYLISLLGNRVELVFLPLIVFLAASGMAFATGTSFGTMAILIPMILPLSFSMGAFGSESQIIFWLTAAAIMDGAIFGDHCSPISDTTVLSSISAGCDHIDHVSTQIGYAVTTMIIASGAGYLGVAFGMPIWSYFILFPIISLFLLFSFGKRIPRSEG